MNGRSATLHLASGLPGIMHTDTTQRRRLVNEQGRFTLLLIAPAAAILVLFQVIPIFIGANASFRDWALQDPKKTWLGLAHYTNVLTDPYFVTVVLPNTFVFM